MMRFLPDGPIMVNLVESTAHLQILLSVVRYKTLVACKILAQPSTFMTQDLIDLAQLLYPTQDTSKLLLGILLNNIFPADLVAQHPRLATVDLSLVTRGNFFSWLDKEAPFFGGLYLPIVPSSRVLDAPIKTQN